MLPLLMLDDDAHHACAYIAKRPSEFIRLHIELKGFVHFAKSRHAGSFQQALNSFLFTSILKDQLMASRQKDRSLTSLSLVIVGYKILRLF